MAQNNQSLIPAEVIQGKIKYVKEMVKKLEPTLESTLPKHITSKRLMRVVVNCLTTTPELVNCVPVTLVRAVLQSAMLGLEPNTPLQEAALIPFTQTDKRHPNYGKKEVQFQPMYQGLMKLARQSGEIASWRVGVVYEKDEFEYEETLDGTVFRHKPIIDGDRGNLKLAYSIVRFKDPSTPASFEWMNRADIQKVRAVSKTERQDWSPWNKFESSMWLKSVIKKHAKTLPKSLELANAIQMDDQAEIAEPQTYDEIVMDVMEGVDPSKEIPFESGGTRTSEIKNDLAEKAAKIKQEKSDDGEEEGSSQSASDDEGKGKDDPPGESDSDGIPKSAHPSNESSQETSGGDLFPAKKDTPKATKEHATLIRQFLHPGGGKNWDEDPELRQKAIDAINLHDDGKLSAEDAEDIINEAMSLPNLKKAGGKAAKKKGGR